MGQASVITNDRPQTTTPTIPIECAEGHRIYLVYLPSLDHYGFSCPVCHHLGVTVQDRKIILEVVSVSGGLKELSGDLVLYSHMKAENVACPKGHQISLMSVGDSPEVPGGGYGFFEDHCKLYAMEVVHKGRVLALRPKGDFSPAKGKLGLIVH